MTRTGDREIRSVSWRPPDNPRELARMYTVGNLGCMIKDVLQRCIPNNSS